MSLRLIVEKLRIDNNKFITSTTLRILCKKLNISYYSCISYLLNNRYIVRILRGIFYVKSIEERKANKIDMNYFEIIRKALDIKGVEGWYFGLDTALKLNNLTHEFFNVDYLISNSIYRAKPFMIMGHKIKFIKLNRDLFNFGILKTKGEIPFSNLEKTVLDFIHLGRYNGLTDDEINNKIMAFVDYCSKNKLKKYSRNYPNTVNNFLKMKNIF